MPGPRTLLLEGDHDTVTLPAPEVTAERKRELAARYGIDPEMHGRWPDGWRARLALMGDGLELRGFQHRPGADQHAVDDRRSQLGDDGGGVGHRARDLHGAQPAVDGGAADVERCVAVGMAHDHDHATVAEQRRQPVRHRCTAASPARHAS
jgi:hypothetical protein